MQSQAMGPVDLRALCVSILESHLDAATARQIDLGIEADARHHRERAAVDAADCDIARCAPAERRRKLLWGARES